MPTSTGTSGKVTDVADESVGAALPGETTDPPTDALMPTPTSQAEPTQPENSGKLAESVQSDQSSVDMAHLYSALSSMEIQSSHSSASVDNTASLHGLASAPSYESFQNFGGNGDDSADLIDDLGEHSDPEANVSSGEEGFEDEGVGRIDDGPSRAMRVRRSAVLSQGLDLPQGFSDNFNLYSFTSGQHSSQDEEKDEADWDKDVGEGNASNTLHSFPSSSSLHKLDDTNHEPHGADAAPLTSLNTNSHTHSRTHNDPWTPVSSSQTATDTSSSVDSDQYITYTSTLDTVPSAPPPPPPPPPPPIPSTLQPRVKSFNSPAAAENAKRCDDGEKESTEEEARYFTAVITDSSPAEQRSELIFSVDIYS